MPVPEPYLKSMPSVLARVRIDSIVSSTELMKQAEHCGCSSTPTLNQTGELKAIFCWTSRCVSSAWKVGAVRLGGEVAVLLRPSAVMVSATRADQLADRALALGRARRAAEVLRGDHVGGQHRPGLGDLDVLLLEDDLAVLAGDAGGAQLPGDLVGRVHARRGEVAGNGQAAVAHRRLPLLRLLPLLRRRGLQLTLHGIS